MCFCKFRLWACIFTKVCNLSWIYSREFVGKNWNSCPWEHLRTTASQKKIERKCHMLWPSKSSRSSCLLILLGMAFPKIVEKLSTKFQTLFKNLTANAAKFLKCIWPFWDVMQHERFKTGKITKNVSATHVFEGK